jgi:hypothetical protein
MQVINWLELQPLPADLDALNGRLHEALPLRKVCRLLVETTLRAYPWMGRADLISCYHPSQTYKQGQRFALFISDPQNARRTVWLLAQVKHARLAENPIQGRFQVLTLDLQGRQIQMAGGIANASYAEPNLSNYSSEELAWLVEWVSNTYAASLQTTLKKLIQKGKIRGRLAGEIFVPEQVSALSPELLHPVFARISPARPWISLEEIVKGIPDLSQLKRETIPALLRAALKESPYRSLGGGRWTTPELFNQLNREVPQSLPGPRVRSNVPIWTKRDEKDLAGYDGKFMPTEAQRALEELGIVERLPEPEESPWRPPNGPVRLPSLNYLHITQAYFPVGFVLRAFAPDVQMVFVQFINGDHQPFLLDRENGLLKAVHPEELRTRILKEGLPAGTYLWLEYEGNEQYRIVPRRLPFKRLVPCKLAELANGHLHIEHTQISMMYEGNPSLFKTNMRFEEIEALFAEAGRVDLSVRDAMIYAMQELCATDPDHRADRLDLFNAVFLQRMCSPKSVSLLLYTQPCFEQVRGGYFRYKPTPDAPMSNPRKRKDRLSKLWDNLLSNPLAPDPVAEERTTAGGGLEGSYPVFPTFTPDLGLPAHLRGPETEPDFSVLALPLVAVEEDTAGQTVLREETRIETLLQDNDEPEPLTPTDAAGPVISHWRDSLDLLIHSLEELVNHEPSDLPAEEANTETETYSGPPLEAAGQGSSSFSSPFRWEPKPAWLDVPSQPKPLSPNPADTRPPVYISRIPIRPLHKKPFYQRVLFYLRGWLRRIFEKTV